MNFWNQLESKKIMDREQIEKYLLTKLGEPTNQTQTNLLSDLTKKIHSYYSETEKQNSTTYSLFGSVQEIHQKRFKEGRRKGQIFYSVKLKDGQRLRASKEDLPEAKWKQIEQLALLGRNLVFKYKKWITNKDILDFWEQEGKG